MFGIWKSNITNVHLCAHPVQDLLGGVHDLRTNSITGYQGDRHSAWGKSFEIIVTIFSRVKQLQKGEQDKRNRSQGEGSQYFADKNDGKPRVTESIGCLIRRVRKDLDKNKESHLESTLALWPEAVDKSWACWRVGREACWMVGKEASLTMRERGSMLIWKRRIVIKALFIFSHPICFCPTLPMKDYTWALQAAQRGTEQSLMQ